MLEAFIAAETVVEGAGALEALGAGEALGATGAFDMGLGGVGEAMGLGGAGEAMGLMAPTTGAGITQAAMGPATQGIVAGGEGAGAAGINSQMVNMTQNAGSSAGAGAAQSAAPMARSIGQAAAPAIDAGATDMSLGQAGAANAANASTVVGQGDKASQIANFADIQGYGASEVPAASSFFDNPFMGGVKKAMDMMGEFSEKHPYYTAAGAYLGAKKLGLLDDNGATAANRTPDKGIGYSMSPNFQGRFANPQDYQYTPKRYSYAEGGIMQADGVPAYAQGDLTSSLDYYSQMMDQRAHPPAGKAAPRGERGDAGIYYDLDPDTRYQDALTAAQIRQAKVNKRANMQLPGEKRPMPMGQLNLAPPGVKGAVPGASLDPENAAQGGIMHLSLGGYAAGGNPRLLKGPGDGMSDNIPATINGRQPARLADGEFVVPADVVSHLGNGSTDAGAKILHHMMTQVRKERTGNPKQGKQINPNKFVPK